MLCAVMKCHSGTGKTSNKPYNRLSVLSGSGGANELADIFSDFPVAPGLYDLDISGELKFGKLQSTLKSANLQAPLKVLAFDAKGVIDVAKSIELSLKAPLPAAAGPKIATA